MSSIRNYQKREFLPFNPGLKLAGTSVDFTSGSDGGSASGKNNVVAKDAFVKGDIRAVSLEQLERAKTVMQQIVNENYPQN